jgi:hypothetical protein
MRSYLIGFGLPDDRFEFLPPGVFDEFLPETASFLKFIIDYLITSVFLVFLILKESCPSTNPSFVL